MTHTQREFWPDTGPTLDGGETLPRFLPTPQSFDAMRGKGGEQANVTANQDSLLAAARDGRSISSAAASLARTSATLAGGPDLTATALASGGSSPVSFACFDPESCSWRTWQRCLLGGWMPFSGRWPRSGMMRNGIAYRLPPLVPRISGTGCSLRPTPISGDWKGQIRADGTAGMLSGKVAQGWFPTPYGLSANQGQGDGEFGKAIRRWPTPISGDWKGISQPEGRRPVCDDNLPSRIARETGGQLNPTFVEHLMGFPKNWTEVE